MIKQRTLHNPVQATGVAAHSGKTVYLTLKPAPEDTGIIFSLTDRPEIKIPALAQYIVDTRMSTTLGREGITISMVEHLLSAFAGLGIDNAYVEVSSGELPIMDGSAGPLLFLIRSAGIREQEALKKFIRIKKEIVVEQQGKYAKLKPHSGFKVSFAIDFDHPAVRKSSQVLSLDFSLTSYAKEVSRARTFGFLSDYEKLKEMNLALGSNFDNTIVIGDYKILNEEGLRYDNEFVRHKILDAIGDLYLLGHNLIGEYVGYKSGHAINSLLLKALLQDLTAWEYITFKDNEKLPKAYLEEVYVG